MQLKRYLTILMVSFTGFAYSQDFFKGTVAQKPSTTASSKNTIGGYPVLTVDGEWRFIVSTVTMTTGTGSGLPLGNVFGFSLDKNQHHYSIDTQVNLQERGDIGDWTDEPCKGDEFLWVSSTGGRFANINCATVGFNADFDGHPSVTYLKTFGKLRSIVYDIPRTLIVVSFTRYTSQGRRVRYVVNLNPEYYGFDKVDNPDRRTNDWNKLFSLKDEKKKEFINNISNWAIDVQKRMDMALDKNPQAFTDLKVLSSYIMKKSLQNSPAPTAIEEKLKNLKTLFEKNLITQDQYNEQVKALLN